MKKPKVLFIDLDGTLISTRSGKASPQGLWDMQINVPVMYKIKEIEPEHVFIVTNQSSIGKSCTEEEFEKKLDYIVASVKSYIRHPKLKTVEGIYCASVDRDDPFRKPNTGMLDYMIVNFDAQCPKDQILMVGDASGGPGKSDIDLKTAENYGIHYMDVDRFKTCYLES